MTALSYVLPPQRRQILLTGPTVGVVSEFLYFETFGSFYVTWTSQATRESCIAFIIIIVLDSRG